MWTWDKQLITKLRHFFCMKRFSCIKTILFQKNFTIQIQWFVSRILTIVCICLWIRVYMAICECVCIWLCVCVCAANVSVPIVLRKFIIFNMHVPNSNYVSFTLTHANWYLAFQNVTKFDSTVSKLDWVKKIYENYCDIWIDENKGARYKGNIFSGTRFQCRTVLFRNQSTKSDSTFQSYDGKKILLGCDCCFDWASHSLSYDKKFQQILKKNETIFFETTQFSTCNPWNGEKKNYISSELSVQILTSN